MPTLRIVSFNDVYTLENLPRMATLIRRRREEKPTDAFLVVVAGDVLAPSMLSSLDFGAGMIDCLNAIGVTHVTLGNHEDDVPAPELQKRIGEFRGTWIDTNAHAFGDILPRTATIDVGGVLVGLLGVVMDDPSTYRDVPFGSTGVDPCNETARKVTRELLATCHTVIPITHQPIDDDRALAASEPHVPLILGGHEHVPFVEQIGETWLVKAGADAINALVIDLTWPEGEPAHAPKVTVVLEPVKLHDEEPAVRARVERHMARVHELETSTLLTLAPGQTLSSIGTRVRQTSLATMICTRVREVLGTEVALFNGGGIRASREYGVHFTYGDLKGEVPFDNELVTVRMPGRVLADAVAASRAHLPAESGGFLHVDDRVEVDPATNRPVRVAGSPLDETRIYDVALVRNFFGGLDHNEPLVTFSHAHPEAIPPEGSGRDAKHVLIESFARDLYAALPDFDVVDRNHDGRVSPEELEAAIADVTHEAPSHVVTDLVLGVVDTDHDGGISKEEAAAALTRRH